MTQRTVEEIAKAIAQVNTMNTYSVAFQALTAERQVQDELRKELSFK